MQTDSSASLTYLASVSATEYTTTVRMPSSRQARWMRSAISPRLAIRIFSNTSADEEKRLTVFDRLAVFDQDRLDHARGVGLDLVHQFHRLDDADGLTLFDRLSDLDERIGGWRGGAVKRAHDRRLDDVARLSPRGFSRASGSRRGARRQVQRRGRGRLRQGRPLRALDDPDLLFALGDLEFGDAGLLHQVDQLLELAQIHRLASPLQRPPGAALRPCSARRPAQVRNPCCQARRSSLPRCP